MALSRFARDAPAAGGTRVLVPSTGTGAPLPAHDCLPLCHAPPSVFQSWITSLKFDAVVPDEVPLLSRVSIIGRPLLFRVSFTRPSAVLALSEKISTV